MTVRRIVALRPMIRAVLVLWRPSWRSSRGTWMTWRTWGTTGRSWWRRRLAVVVRAVESPITKSFGSDQQDHQRNEGEPDHSDGAS